MTSGHLKPGGRTSGRRGSGRQSSAPVIDPVAIVRARDLLDRADLLLDNAAGVDDEAERFRQLYLVALRGAGAALAIHEAVGARPVRRVTSNAWTRIGVVVPALGHYAEFFAAQSRTRMNIESGIERDLAPGRLDQMNRRVLTFLDAVEALVIAYEQGGRTPAAGVIGHSA